MQKVPPQTAQVTNFIKNRIEKDLEDKKITCIKTRFPPEPNGYLHIGHAKSICLNFGLAQQYEGQCHLRFDDTNPANEDEEYVQAIQEDIKWLGFDWQKKLFHASDYFEQLFEFAIKLITKNKAYVCDLSAEEVRRTRGSLTQGGQNSPYRERCVSENIDLLTRMKKGEFAEGSKTLRAKIDMSSGNINLRDPAIYRIKKIKHQRTGKDWCIYPMYDYTHCLSDSIEGITHSVCTLEFEDHRPLYDWFIEQLEMPCHPQQIEFSRLNLNYTVTSKRKLKHLVDNKFVNGWDDPRMPTIAGFKKRGYTPASIRKFCENLGVSKQNSVTDVTLLEECLRDDLNTNAPRAMVIQEPLKVIIENYDKEEWLDAPNHPKNDFGTRKIPFSNELYIERTDFMENPSKGFFRLTVNKEIRLRNSYILKCTALEKDRDGKILCLKATIDQETLGKNPSDGRKVKGVIHWVSAKHCKFATLRLYDRLFSVEDPSSYDVDHFSECLNKDSLVEVKNCPIEPSLLDSNKSDRFQFERVGYFCAEPNEFSPENLIFNRITTLRDGWKTKTN